MLNRLLHLYFICKFSNSQIYGHDKNSNTNRENPTRCIENGLLDVGG